MSSDIHTTAKCAARSLEKPATPTLDAICALTRRSFATGALHALLFATLVQRSAHAGALEGTFKHEVRPWLGRLEEASSALATGSVSPLMWQREVEAALAGLDLREFMRALDFERLAATASFPESGEGMQRLYFLDERGRLQVLRFRPFLFTLKRGTAVVPHGHHNMATMHMMLDGHARIRHFDRIQTTPTEMLIRPVSDLESQPGEVSSISDEHQNIHWFQALSDRVFMFNIGVYQIGPGPWGERDYIDPVGGVSVDGGLIRAARLGRADAYAKYGRV